MKSALLSKIAMCVCPPAIVATTAVTVPPVRRAVHRMTAPRAAPAVAKARPRRAFTAAYDCTPTAVPLTNLAPLGNGVVAPADPVPQQRLTEAYPVPVGPVAFSRPVGVPYIPSVIPAAFGPPPQEQTVVVPSPVPEISTWAMTVTGVGAVGWALRRRRTAPRIAPAPAEQA